MKKVKEAITLLVGLGIVVLFFHFTNIGCPIRFLTGISCPGCGTTRAVWEALHFRFGRAFYYHPLFWVVPVLALLFFFWERIPKSGQKVFLWLLISAYFVVYLLRLNNKDCTVVTADISSGWIVAVFNKIRQCFV